MNKCDEKYKIPTIIRFLLDDTYDPITKSDKRDALGEFMGYSIDSKKGCIRVLMLIKQDDLFFDTAKKILTFFDYQMVVTIKNNDIPIESVQQATSLVNEVLKAKKISKTTLAKELNVTYVTLAGYFRETKMKVGTICRLFHAVGYEISVKSNNGKGKTYTLGDKDYTDYVIENVISKFPFGDINKNTHSSFIDNFFNDCVVHDVKSRVRVAVLYGLYLTYWDSHKEKRPIRKEHLKDKETDYLNQREFEEMCQHKVLKDMNYFIGIKIKEAKNEIV